jgi:hypothetical protein
MQAVFGARVYRKSTEGSASGKSAAKDFRAPTLSRLLVDAQQRRPTLDEVYSPVQSLAHLVTLDDTNALRYHEM